MGFKSSLLPTNLIFSLHASPASPADLWRRKFVHDVTVPREAALQGAEGTLTQHADKGVGQQIAVLIRGVALVHGPTADLGVPEDDGVPGHLTVWVGWCRYRQERCSS